jgi:predicted PurR-regulated permease PerM
MKTYSNPQRAYLLVTLIVILGFTLCYMSWMIFGGIMGAIVFFTIFRPLHIYLTESRKWKDGISAIAILILSFLILILPFLAFFLMVHNKIMYYEAHQEELGILKEKLWPLIKNYISNKKNAENIINGIQSKIFLVFSNALNRITDILLQISVLYFLLYYMLKEHVKLEEAILKYLPLKKHEAERLGKELTNITNSNILGQGFICFVQGILVTVGFFIFGIDDAIFWGVVCFFLSFIPFIGAPLVFVPAGIIQIYSGNDFNGFGIIIWGFVLVTTIDNVIRFFLAKKIGDVHPIISIIGVIIGIPAFGILGLAAGPLMISYFIILMKIWEENNRVKSI